jgi:hypothetical protein
MCFEMREGMRDTDKNLGARLFDLQLNYVTFIFTPTKKEYTVCT